MAEVVGTAGSVVDGPPGLRGRGPALLGSPGYLRLFIAQVVSSLGDWIGFVAITSVAARVGGGSPEAAVSVVLSARLIPGFFLAPLAGVVVDRWDRKKIMVACDVGRALVLAGLPWVDTVPGLFFASLLLEILTLLWTPSKEASVPNLVRTEDLATANSLGLVAAYGTFPVAALLFGWLVKIGERVLELGGIGGLPQETVPLAFDAGTFALSALLIATIPIRRSSGASTAPVSASGEEARGLRRTLVELREGWESTVRDRVVRSIVFGIATGLIGGGMLVPLGRPFVDQVLGGGAAGFGLLLGALGTGVAVGIVTLTVVQRRLPHERLFSVAVFGAGASIIGGASMSTLTPALVLVSLLGVFAGAVYVLGFTILQTNVADEVRGRTFAAFYTIIRLCLLLAFAVGGVLSSVLDRLSQALVGREIGIGGAEVAVPGVRLTLWLAGTIILLAGALSVRTLRGVRETEGPPVKPPAPKLHG